MVRKTIWSKKIKKNARKLRKSGLSYGQINKKTGISKSTLHFWMQDIKRPNKITQKERLAHLEKIRPLATKAIKKERENRLKKITTKILKETKTYPLVDKKTLKIMLSMLYWAEGAKGRGTLGFTNTDPKLMLLYITLLRACYKIDEKKFRVRIHIHHYHTPKEAINFWSNLLKIPKNQFGKIYIKTRSKSKKYRRNFAGICILRYHSENLRFEILEIGYIIADQIINTFVV